VGTYSRAAEPSKGMAIASLVVGILAIPTFGCFVIGAIGGLVMGIIALTRANREPQVYGGKGVAIAGIAANALALVAIPLIGIIAAIAIPSLLRARVSANESATIGDIRTVISAQAAYQSANGGFYDTMECLARPEGCIPGYTGPFFLDAELASARTKSGYARTFVPGPAAPPDATQAGKLSPSSLMTWAYVAVPANRNQTGVRGFCGDASGRICFTSDGTAPEVVDGACALSCTDLR